jgi:hypothetical protein
MIGHQLFVVVFFVFLFSFSFFFSKGGDYQPGQEADPLNVLYSEKQDVIFIMNPFISDHQEHVLSRAAKRKRSLDHSICGNRRLKMVSSTLYYTHLA